MDAVPMINRCADHQPNNPHFAYFPPNQDCREEVIWKVEYQARYGRWSNNLITLKEDL